MWTAWSIFTPFIQYFTQFTLFVLDCSLLSITSPQMYIKTYSIRYSEYNSQETVSKSSWDFFFQLTYTSKNSNKQYIKDNCYTEMHAL